MRQNNAHPSIIFMMVLEQDVQGWDHKDQDQLSHGLHKVYNKQHDSAVQIWGN